MSHLDYIIIGIVCCRHCSGSPGLGQRVIFAGCGFRYFFCSIWFGLARSEYAGILGKSASGNCCFSHRYLATSLSQHDSMGTRSQTRTGLVVPSFLGLVIWGRRGGISRHHSADGQPESVFKYRLVGRFRIKVQFAVRG